VVDVISRKQAAVVSAVLGLLVAAVAQLAWPLASPPLYDGVVAVAPYVYVNPPPGQPGGAQGSSKHLAMIGHTAPQVVVGTPEQPAQAQIVAQEGSLKLPPTATSIEVKITPLDPQVDAGATGAAEVLGNVYRITIVDQDGHAATAPASALVSVVLRAPSDVPGAQLGLLVDNAWQLLKSEAGFGSTFVTVATRFGDFAVIVPGTAPASAAPSPAASLAPTSARASETAAPASTSAPAATAVPGTGGSDGSISPQVIGAVVLVGLISFMVASSLWGARREGRH
jgi:hypothetical protein